MTLLGTWDPRADSADGAVLALLGAAARQGLDRRRWSLCELRLGKSDVSRLEAWLGGLRPAVATALLREERQRPGELWAGAVQLGLVVLIVVSERARQSCAGHQVWPALAGLWFDCEQTRRTLVGEGGQPTAALRGAIELTVERCRLRHALYDDEGHRWFRTLRLQYGYSEPALVAGLVERLYGPREPYLEPALSGGLTAVVETLRGVHLRRLSAAAARASLSDSPWILPTWIDALLDAASRLALSQFSVGHEPPEEEETASNQLLGAPLLTWEREAPLFRARAELGVTSGGSPHLTLQLQGATKLRWLRQSDGSYALHGGEQDVLLPPVPAVTATLVARDGSIVAEQTVELWDEEACVVGYGLGGPQIPVAELAIGEGTALLVPRSGVSVAPSGDPVVGLATRTAHRFLHLPTGLTVHEGDEMVLELRGKPLPRLRPRADVAELSLEVMRSGIWERASEQSVHEVRELRTLPWRVRVPSRVVTDEGATPLVSLLAGPQWLEVRRSRPRAVAAAPGIGEALEALVERPFNYQVKRADRLRWSGAGRIVDHGRLRHTELRGGRCLRVVLTEEMAEQTADFVEGTEVVVVDGRGEFVLGRPSRTEGVAADYALDREVSRPRAVLLKYGTARLGAFWWPGWHAGLEALEPRGQAAFADAVWAMRLPFLLEAPAAALRAAVAAAPVEFLGAWLRPAPALEVTTLEGGTWMMLLRSLLFEASAGALLRTVGARAAELGRALGDEDVAGSVVRLGALHPRLARAFLQGILAATPRERRRPLLWSCRQQAMGAHGDVELDERTLRGLHETLQATCESPPGVDAAYARHRSEAVGRGWRIEDWPGTHAVLRATTARQLALYTALLDLV